MIAGLAGFAEGFADSAKMKKQWKQDKIENERADRMLGLAERGMLPASYGLNGAVPQDGGTGYGMSAPGGTGTPGAPGANTGGLFGLIDKTEGGGNYDTLFGHSQNGGRFDGVKVSDMTLAEVSAFADPGGEYGQWVKGQVGRVATPMGRHQIVGTTLRNTMKAMGLSPDTKFTPQIQDSMATYLATNRLAGLSNPAQKRAALRAEWEGFKHVSDAALDAAILDFEANGSGTMRARGVVH